LLKHFPDSLLSRGWEEIQNLFEVQMATKKKSSGRKSSSGSDPKSKRIVHNKMEKVMHEYKHHELSRGRGGKVKNPKQAIAIGLSEARRSGADIPPNPNQKQSATKKKGATKKKAATKKSTGKKTTKKAAAKKSTTKKTTKKATKKTASKKR
jgi:hypothetical protein